MHTLIKLIELFLHKTRVTQCMQIKEIRGGPTHLSGRVEKQMQCLESNENSP